MTNPEITLEDKVLAAAQIFTQEMKGNVTGKSEEMEALGKVEKHFETIAKQKSREQKLRHNNEHAIRLPRRTNAQSPRVAKQIFSKSKGGRTSSKGGLKSRADSRVSNGSSC